MRENSKTFKNINSIHQNLDLYKVKNADMIKNIIYIFHIFRDVSHIYNA